MPLDEASSRAVESERRAQALSIGRMSLAILDPRALLLRRRKALSQK
jgi:hypothetical protein